MVPATGRLGCVGAALIWLSTDVQIFPVTYVEAMPEPTPAELQEEAQEEARVFASLGQWEILSVARSSPARPCRPASAEPACYRSIPRRQVG